MGFLIILDSADSHEPRSSSSNVMSMLNSFSGSARADSVVEHAILFFRDFSTESRNICSLLKSAVFLCMEVFILAKLSRTSTSEKT